jgi:hypothetical protein
MVTQRATSLPVTAGLDIRVIVEIPWESTNSHRFLVKTSMAER